MKTEVTFWDGPITESGLYLIRYKAFDLYELLSITPEGEDENAFLVSVYPNNITTMPLENVSRFEWIKLEDLK